MRIVRTFPRDVLSALPVAARRSAHEGAALVAQRDREAVDLQLGDEAPGLLAQHPRVAREPRLGLLPRVGVLEGEHRLRVHDRLESLGGLAADAARRRVGGRELRVRGLERLELAHQPIELGVGDLGLVVDVVEPLVAAEISSRERLDAAPRGFQIRKTPSSACYSRAQCLRQKPRFSAAALAVRRVLPPPPLSPFCRLPSPRTRSPAGSTPSRRRSRARRS